jgi:hypothetical protein
MIDIIMDERALKASTLMVTVLYLVYLGTFEVPSSSNNNETRGSGLHISTLFQFSLYIIENVYHRHGSIPYVPVRALSF